jgi:flagellar protein FliJ
MKRYRFRLAQVLRVRTIELDRAVGAVAAARLELAAAQQRTASAVAAYQALPTVPEGNTSADLRANTQRLKLAVDAIMAARATEQTRAAVVEERLAEWAEADKKVRLLTELDTRARQRHAAEVLADEQKTLDDLVTSRLGRASC